MRILGISAFYHDSAAALVEDGRIVAAAQEERFTRKKHDPSFPSHAIAYCLQEAGARLDELDYVVFYDKPFLKFERLLETYVAMAPRGFRSFKMAIPLWLREKLFLDNLIDLKADGSFRLDISYFDYCTGLTMTNDKFSNLFGAPVRRQDKLLTPFHMDIAASIQAVLEEAVLRLTRSLAKETGAH